MIDVNNETDFGVDEVEFAELATYVLREMNIADGAELAILFVDEPAMEQLHIQWMDEPGPTDVLSFPIDGAEALERAHRGRTRRGMEALQRRFGTCHADAAAGVDHRTLGLREQRTRERDVVAMRRAGRHRDAVPRSLLDP